MSEKTNSRWYRFLSSSFLVYVLAVVIALALGAILILIVGGNVVDAYAATNAVLGPGQAKATCLPALAAALALPWWAVPPAPAVGVWNAEAGTCRASSSQRLIQQQPQQRPAGHRSSPDSRWSREQAGARPQGGLFCQRSLRGREIKGLLTHQTRGLRSLNGLELKFKVTKAAGR